MLETLDISEQAIAACLAKDYLKDINRLRVEFLPLGADSHTAAFRATTDHETYFVKVRRGDFDQIAIRLIKMLHDQDAPVIAPIANTRGHLATSLDDFTITVYPFVAGTNGFQRVLTAQDWITLGQALQRIHTRVLPPNEMLGITQETFSPYWRDRVKHFQAQVESIPFVDDIAAEFGLFVREKKHEIIRLSKHAHELAALIRGRNLPFVLCHGDIHVGNLLITPAGTLYIVDWDAPILAPKERDLMFMGMGLGSQALYSHDRQAALFYEGYGASAIDPAAIAYYRCERIIEDVAAYCEQILLTTGDRVNRQEGLSQFQQQFNSDDVVERAFQSVAELRLSDKPHS